MSPVANARLWDISDLRIRYEPSLQAGRGMLLAAPWVNLAMLLLFFFIAPSAHVIQPGITIELPTAPTEAGVVSSATAVVLLQGNAVQVYFDDQPFALARPDRMRDLQTAWSRVAATTPGAVLTLEADKNVPHGALVRLYDLALSAGLRTIHLASRAPAGGER